jgi:hypothetical protein
MLLPTINFYLEHDGDTSELERQLKASLPAFLNSPELLALPVPFLNRVIDFSEDCDFDGLFQFGLRVLDRAGPSASILFQNLDLARCSSPQLDALRGHRSFVWGFVGDSICSTLIGLQTTCLRLASVVETQNAAFEGLQAQHRDLMQRYARQQEMNENMAARLSAFEAALPLLATRTGLECLEAVAAGMCNWTHFPTKSGPHPDGIVAHLTRKCGENPARNGVVDVSLSGVYDSHRLGPDAFDFMTATDAVAGETPLGPQWISFDFKGMRLIPTAYWIRSFYGDARSAHLKSWVLEGCQDPSESDWVQLDRHDNNALLNGPHAIATFPITHLMKCRAIRLKSTGTTHCDGNWCVIIAGFEIFGYLRE